MSEEPQLPYREDKKDTKIKFDLTYKGRKCRLINSRKIFREIEFTNRERLTVTYGELKS